MSTTGLLFELLDSAGDDFGEELHAFGCVYQWARRQRVKIAWPEEQRGDVVALRRLRDQLAESVLDDDRARARRALGSLAQAHRLVPALVAGGAGRDSPPRGGPAPPTVTLRTLGDRVADALAAVLVWEAIRLHTSGDIDRIGECDARSCTRLFVDGSPHRTRRFCSESCGTRARVDRYRMRKRWARPAPAAPGAAGVVRGPRGGEGAAGW